jgi:hypothetical protein
MSLDVLAPDQRAVVQLVLQQDRSYDELAGLLGIAPEAVRDRARRGLERLAPGDELTADERGELADYLLGQQSVSGREVTRALLSASTPARDWAAAVAAELEPLARGGLPEIPRAEAPEPAPDATVVEPLPAAEAIDAGEDPDAAFHREVDDDEDFDDEDFEDGEPSAPAVRARPRPRAGREPAAAPGAADPAAPAAAAAATPPTRPGRPPAPSGPRSSRLGGGLIIGGLLIAVIALAVWLISKGGDENDGTARTPTATATVTATATPALQGSIELTPPTGGRARGQMDVFLSKADGVTFSIRGTDVPPNRDREAYAVWLTGGDAPHRLGFAPIVGSDGLFGTRGPQEGDQERFLRWFTKAKAVEVTRETTQAATTPGPVVLRGRIPSGSQGSG